MVKYNGLLMFIGGIAYVVILLFADVSFEVALWMSLGLFGWSIVLTITQAIADNVE